MSTSSQQDGYVMGNIIRCCGVFENEAGDPIDPEHVNFKVKDPAGMITLLVFGTDVALVKDSVGNYHADVNADTHGMWFYRFYSTGEGKAADEESFSVLRSEFS
jgi:hypothetical protein